MEPPTDISQTPPAAREPTSHGSVMVYQDDTVGAIFLGLIALALVVAYVRSEARQRSLLAQLKAA